MSNFSPVLNVMLASIRKASNRLVRDFGEIEQLQSSLKGPNDFTRKAYTRIYENLITELQTVRPGFGVIIGEEKLKGKDPEFTWIIDPINGYGNLLRAIPYFCMSIGLQKRINEQETEIIAAVIDAPALKETFWAEKGNGCWGIQAGNAAANQARLRSSSRKDLTQALVLVHSETLVNDAIQQRLSLISDRVYIQSLLSSELCYSLVAAGKADCYIHPVSKNSNEVGSLLVLEAGGLVKEITISGRQYILALNANLAKEFMKTFE
jgi:myo-inositol-1(or 4)-monophosphatase